MSDVIQFTIPREATELIARCRDRSGLARALREEMNLQNQLVIGDTTKNRFTGKGPFPVAQHRLGVKTNRLRSSLRATKAVGAAENISSSIGTNVKYAGYHEFGGRFQVRARARRMNFVNGRIVSEKSLLNALKANRRAIKSAEKQRTKEIKTFLKGTKEAKDKRDLPTLGAQLRSVEKVDAKRVIAYGRAYTIIFPKRAPIFHGIQDRSQRYGEAMGRTAINFIRGGAP